MTTTEDLISTTEIAKAYGVSRSAALAWIKKGLFPHATKVKPDRRNSPYRVPRSEVEGYFLHFVAKWPDSHPDGGGAQS